MYSSSDLSLLFFLLAIPSYIIQNVGGGTSVLRVMATDRDIGPNAMLFYYITSGNQDLTFRMDRMTGEMVTRPAPPDRERQQKYILTVTVEDDGTPPLSVSCRESQEVNWFDISMRSGFLPQNKNIHIRLIGGVSECFLLLHKFSIPLVCSVGHGDDQTALHLVAAPSIGRVLYCN